MFECHMCVVKLSQVFDQVSQTNPYFRRKLDPQKSKSPSSSDQSPSQPSASRGADLMASSGWLVL